MADYYEIQRQEAIKDIMLKTKVSEERATDIYNVLYDVSSAPGYARIILKTVPFSVADCPNVDVVGEVVYAYLTELEYMRQLDSPGEDWYCPCTQQTGTFDDDFFEALHG